MPDSIGAFKLDDGAGGRSTHAGSRRSAGVSIAQTYGEDEQRDGRAE